MIVPVTIALGRAISKSIFKTWLGDSDVLSDTSTAVYDAITAKIPDWRARQSTARQMERIAERAAEIIQPKLEREWALLDDGEKSSVILSVEHAIISIDLSTEDLARDNFSVETLSAKISRKLVLIGISESGTALAAELAYESSQLIVDILTSMPEFHRDTYIEILKREELILSAVEKVFVELENILSQTSQAGSKADATLFEENYRRAAARNLDKIELFGLDSTIRSSSRQHSLTTAYISLSVSGSILSNDNKIDDLSSANLSEITNLSESDETKNVSTLRAERAATLSQKIIIKGEAGSGKTTLLQSLAVRCATAAYENDMNDWNGYIPFFVRLREMTSDKLPSPEQLPALVAPTVAGTMPLGWAHNQLLEGRAILLVDGLDEISKPRREATRRWLEEFTSSFPACRVIITSRPPAVPDGWLASQGFFELELLPMTPNDVSAFIDHWHEAVARAEQDAESQKKARILAPALKERIRVDRSLRELASTPLLCAMLCAMNRDRRQVLPSNRISLYDAAVQTILHNRDEQRQVRILDFPSIEYETKFSILQDIALWMMQNNWSMAENWRLAERVEQISRRYPRLPAGITSMQIVDSLIHRSGILRSPVDGKFDFIHNAFKEFFCAKAIIAEDRFDSLVPLLDQEAWREVSTLATAMADERRRTDFIGKLLKLGDERASSKAMFHLLAVRCLETCTELDLETQDAIKRRIAGLMPPSNFSDARALSAAGDLAVHLLKFKSQRYARSAASCVRALRLIGTQAALDSLEEYGSDDRSTVIKELLAAWPFFDRVEYAKKVLSQSWGDYGRILIDNIQALEGAQYLRKIRRLSIDITREPIPRQGLKSLDKMPALRELDIRCSDTINIDDFATIPNLNRLSLRAKGFLGLENLGSLIELNSITVNCSQSIALTHFGGEKITAFSVNCPRLVVSPNLLEHREIKALSLGHIGRNEPLDFLSKMIGLETLSISADDGLAAFNELSALPSLSTLMMHRCQWLIRVPSFAPRQPIERITFNGCQNLTNIDSLSDLKNVHHLGISGISEDIDFSPISEIQTLRSLSLSGSFSNSNWAFLLKLPKLERISVPRSSFNAVAALGLQTLSITSNHFTPMRTG